MNRLLLLFILITSTCLVSSCATDNAGGYGWTTRSFAYRGWIPVDKADQSDESAYRRIKYEMERKSGILNHIIENGIPDFYYSQSLWNVYYGYTDRGMIYNFDTKTGRILDSYKFDDPKSNLPYKLFSHFSKEQGTKTNKQSPPAAIADSAELTNSAISSVIMRYDEIPLQTSNEISKKDKLLLKKSQPLSNDTLKYWQLLAYEGDADAQYTLANMYYSGESVQQDYITAVKWFTLAAEQGHIKSLRALYALYGDGTGVPQDYNAAIKWLTLAAEQGDVDTQSTLGFHYRLGKGVQQDYNAAIKWFTLAAKQGDIEAQRALGFMYYSGEGVPQDYKTAIKLLTPVAEQGHLSAQGALALIYYQGLSVPQDYKTAAKWFTLAAEQGLTSAQSFLGGMYLLGEGVPQDNIRAYMWYNIAASNGRDPEYRDTLAKGMTPSQLAEAQKLAREWKEKHSN